MVSNDYSFWRTFPLTLALVVTVVTSRLVASKHGNSSLTCDNFRLPPLVVDSTVGSEDSDWHNAPPAGFGYGNWKFAYASNPQYQFLYNLQIDFYPVLPTATNSSSIQQIDLTSYQLPNVSTIHTTYGIDTPIGPNLYNFSVTGGFQESDSYAWIGWGFDTDGDSFFVTFDGATVGTSPQTAGIDIFSRVEGGPTSHTYHQILSCLRGLSHNRLKDYLEAILPTPLDGRRTGSEPASCDLACLNNTIPLA